MFLPEKYGHHGRFMRWYKQGIFELILDRAREYYMSKYQENIWYVIDSSSKKAPFMIDGGKKSTC